MRVDPIDIPHPMRKWLAARAFFGFVGGNLSYLALHILQYSKAVVLEFTNPIFVGILACILLK